MTREDDALTFEIRSTLADNAAFLLFLSLSPGRLLLQIGLFTFVGLWIMAMMVLVGILTAAFDPTQNIRDAVLDYLGKGWIADIGPAAPWIALFCFVVLLANIFIFMPRQCRLMARRILSGYPEIRPEDATMAVLTRFRFDTRGISAAMRDERVFVAWRGIKRLVETRRHLFLMTSRATAFVVPIAALDPSQAVELRDRVAQAIRVP